MTKKPDVTIVVTVHNAEKFLVECIDSVCNQTYSNIEIICVDGGSKDASPHILEEYAKKDDRIRIINDPNTSYGHKLNVGFAEARGEYVGILESDDAFKKNMVELLYATAKEYDADVVSGNIWCHFCIGGKRVGYEVKKYANYGAECYNRLILAENELMPCCHGGIYTALYKQSYLMEKAIKLNETPGASFQDQGFSFLAETLAGRMYNIDVPVYEYRIDNPGSSVYDEKKIVENSWDMDFIESELNKRQISNEDIWERFWRLKYGIYLGKMRTFSDNAREIFGPIFWSSLDKDVKNGLLERSLFNKKDTEVLENYWKDKNYFVNVPRMSKKTFPDKYADLRERIAGKDDFIVFGAFYEGVYLAQVLKAEGKNVYCFCDNSKSLRGTNIRGIEVLSVEESYKEYNQSTYVIVSKRHADAMYEQLKGLGVEDENILMFD